MELIRISKLMSQRGICSRREADEYIEKGWVLVDGEPVSQVGTKIRPDQVITLAPPATRQQARRATILLNKPVGFVSGQPENDYQPAVVLITAENQILGPDGRKFHTHDLPGLAPAGRLDIDSRGLLVFTQDGRIARELTSEEGLIEKEYLVRIRGEIPEYKLAKLRDGISLDQRRLRPAQVELVGQDRLRFILREGRHRQIRRMCTAVNIEVLSLMRLRVGDVALGDLPEGKWRFLQSDESFR